MEEAVPDDRRRWLDARMPDKRQDTIVELRPVKERGVAAEVAGTLAHALLRGVAGAFSFTQQHGERQRKERPERPSTASPTVD
eukprot:gene15029-23317_t